MKTEGKHPADRSSGAPDSATPENHENPNTIQVIKHTTMDGRTVTPGTEDCEALKARLAEIEAALSRAREEAAAYRQIFENSLAGIVVRQEDRVIMVNRAFADMVGYSVAELVDLSTDDLTRLFHPDDREWIADRRRNREAGKTVPDRYEVRFVRKDGTSGWFQMAVSPIEYEGKPAYQSVYIDITDRKRMETALFENEQQFRSLFENAPVGVFQSTPEGRYRMVNAAFAHMVGYDSPDEMMREVNDIAALYVDPAQREEVKRSLRQDGLLNGFEIYLKRRDGGRMWMSIFVRLISDEAGNAAYYDGFTLDITKRKTMEEALTASEGRYRALSDAAFEAVLISKNLYCIDANRAATEMFADSRDRLIGVEIIDLFTLESKETVRRNMLFGCLEPYEVVARKRDGTPFFVEIRHRVTSFQKDVLRMTVIKDVDAQKRVEKQLADANSLLSAVFEQNPAAMAISSAPDNVLRMANTAALTIQGNTDEESHVGMSLDKITRSWKLLTPDQSPVPPDEFPMRLALRGITTDRREYRILRKDGTERWQEVWATPIYDAEGKLIAGLTVFPDITERKEAEAALTREKERFRLLVEQSPFGVSFIDKDGRYLYVNPRFTEIFGYTLEDVPTGAAWLHKAFPDGADRRRAISLWKSDLESAGPGESRPRTLSVACKNGARKIIHFRPVSMPTQEQLVFYEDITDQRRLEAELHHAKKMEAIGTLAGGVAHDFNNLLMGIQGRASLIRMGMEASDKNVEHIRCIEESVQNAADLTKQLLGFARGGKYDVRPADLNEIAEKSARMFARTRKEIRLQTKFDPDLKQVAVDRGQIEQVLLNLLINAWQAMPAGGDIIIETGNVHMERPSTKGILLPGGDYVSLSVADTGVGIEPETRERIFDPFFTTKEMGRGTGLGLASVYGIIRNHDGMITVDSRQGEGSIFTLYLPASDGPLDQPMVEPAGRLRFGTEHILLVEDEAPVAEVGRKMLEELGYRVTTAAGGREAVALFEKSRGEFDLVFLDIIMPDKSGVDVYEHLKRFKPDLRVIFSSGYNLNRNISPLLNCPKTGFIQKPYDIGDLSRKLREMLDPA